MTPYNRLGKERMILKMTIYYSPELNEIKITCSSYKIPFCSKNTHLPERSFFYWLPISFHNKMNYKESTNLQTKRQKCSQKVLRSLEKPFKIGS